MERLQAEMAAAPPEELICQGTLLSREQYLPDLNDPGYEDPRLKPRGKLSASDIERWTAPIAQGQAASSTPRRRRGLAGNG